VLGADRRPEERCRVGMRRPGRRITDERTGHSCVRHPAMGSRGRERLSVARSSGKKWPRGRPRRDSTARAARGHAFPMALLGFRSPSRTGLRSIEMALGPGAQTGRPDDAGPVRSLLGGMASPATSCSPAYEGRTRWEQSWPRRRPRRSSTRGRPHAATFAQCGYF
jgi:hypothetical protein